MAGVRLPNPERAVADIAKLRDYCLNQAHPRGRHKARVFASALGITFENAGELRRALLEAVGREAAARGVADEYGQRYMVDFEMRGPGGTARVRGIWIVLAGENFPRLITCYVL
jgi:hypothetical protein